jgi:1-phosphofructokinase
MVYTITFNPALDYIMHLDTFNEGCMNRSGNESVFYGGKGINVSIMLKRLGIQNTALGFLAGFTGDEIEKEVKSEGVICNFTHLSEGFSRINIKLKTGDSKNYMETEINGAGPVIDTENINDFMGKLKSLCSGDLLVISGSIPPAIPKDIYKKIVESVVSSGAGFIADTEWDNLKPLLEFKPYLIKPNYEELCTIAGRKLENRDEIRNEAKALMDMGAQNVLVSLGGDGAILLDQAGNTYSVKAKEGKVRNSVGAGDSMIAGYIAGTMLFGDIHRALNMAVAAGSATAFTDKIAVSDEVYSLFEV